MPCDCRVKLYSISNFRYPLDAVSEVRRCCTIDVAVRQRTQFELDPLRYAQPMKIDEQWSDMVTSAAWENKATSSVDDRWCLLSWQEKDKEDNFVARGITNTLLIYELISMDWALWSSFVTPSKYHYTIDTLRYHYTTGLDRHFALRQLYCNERMNNTNEHYTLDDS